MAAAPLRRQLKETGMICSAAVLVQYNYRDTNAQNDLFTPTPRASTPRFLCYPEREKLLVAYVHVFLPFTLP